VNSSAARKQPRLSAIESPAEPVPEFRSLRAALTSQTVDEFGELAAKWQHRAHVLRDPAALELVHAVWALHVALRDGDPWLGRMARKSRDYLKRRNRGPRSRPAEADYLELRLRVDLGRGDSRVAAINFLRTLSACPDICAKTRVPITGVCPESLYDSVEHSLRRALHNDLDPENCVKAVLRVLGHSSTKNLFAHRKTKRHG
jgi:hypothetical protein